MMKKTNRQLNQEYDRKQQERVRPKDSAWDHKPLQEVIHNWVKASRTSEQT